MVKVSFSSALVQKGGQKEVEGLIPGTEADTEAVRPVPSRPSRTWFWFLCLGLFLVLCGVLVGGAYLYHYYLVEDVPVYVCGLRYRQEDFMVQEEDQMELELRQVEERIRVLETEQVELINVPVPEFQDGDPAEIVHDFRRRLTAYLDIKLNRCYVISLNTSVVMEPRDLLDLLLHIQAGTYLSQSVLVQEELVVTERLEYKDQLGVFIYRLCDGKETFRLQRRDQILGMQKREAPNCNKIRHFGSGVVVETVICEL